jgi:uridylate kinase
MTNPTLAYQRVLLKLSGEALGTKDCRLQKDILLRISQDIGLVAKQGLQIGIVIGGGNWFRGAQGSDIGLSAMTADHIGMLATLMNALVLQEMLEKQGLPVRVMSAIPAKGLVEFFDAYQARRYLAKQYILIFAGGTGHPFVSTDTAASLRGLEIQADILLKATTVKGIYSADPVIHSDAQFYTQLSYQQVLELELKVMDLAAFCQCRDHKLPIRVFNIIDEPQALMRIVQGEAIGTLVS